MRIIIATILILTILACRNPARPPAARPSSRPAAALVQVQLQPLGRFDAARLEALAAQVRAFYKAEVRVAPVANLPASAWYAPRGRYRADSLLVFLRSIRPAGTDFIVGVAEADISTTSGPHADWGVFGLGSMPGPSCVVSVYRLRRGATEARLRERLGKVVLHEMGHNFGLPHCPTPGCMMADAEGKLATVEQEAMNFCADCRGKIGERLR
jgi:archaemetzincin